jgi:hypothetical protein
MTAIVGSIVAVTVTSIEGVVAAAAHVDEVCSGRTQRPGAITATRPPT